jgi:multiple sugar transport system permease protein
VPLLLLVNKLPWFNGATTWVNSYQVQIIPFIADAFSIFLFYQIFMDIPKHIEEAAFVDGASRMRIYWQLIVPLSRPVFITVAIWQFLVHIGDFLWPLMVTRGDAFRPLMVGMRFFFGQAPLYWGDIMAFASMITLLMLIVFLLFQRWFMRSVASAGITG